VRYVNEEGIKNTDAKLKQFYSSSLAYLERLETHDEQTLSPYIQLCKNIVSADSLILDCGCGTGLSSYLLAKAGFRVIGMDVSPLFLLEGIKKYGKQKGLRFFVGDVSKLPFPDQSFDIVCSYDLLEHIIDIEMVLIEMDRVVKKGGLVIIITPNHLDPIQYLKATIKWRKKEIYKPWEAKSRLMALYKFIRSFFLVINKALGLNKKIYYLEPVLSNNKDACGRDFDATWLTNYFDIENILKELGFSIKDAFFSFEDKIMPIIRLLHLPKILLSFYVKIRAPSIIIRADKMKKSSLKSLTISSHN